jgi:transglutaminase-like putative cysteine protease
MLRHSGLAILFLFAASLLAQTTGGQTTSTKSLFLKDDHSQEAFVIEQFSRKQKFEKEGTSVREDTARIRIQSEAGVQQYGVLNFSYASGTGIFEIRYLRVRKPDGTTVETPPENVQDMAAQITREAPFYSDLHEKHIAVKGLSVGDILEFQISESTTKPLAPGQFWTSYEFTHEQIVLDEQLQISVPRGRSVKVKSSTVQPAINEAGDYRVYLWRSSNLQHKDDSDKKREATERLWEQARGRTPNPDVLLSSFNSWEDVGHWYGGLQDERIKPTAEVAAKAAELTKNAADEEAKVRALYGYVSTEFHYIGVAFGIGRYQPHSAEVVLENRYGDCKDKHTLLAALLAATGIPAYPALVNSSKEVDEDVPSPGQFDHVITFVPTSNGPIWLDTTPEVAPYRFC